MGVAFRASRRLLAALLGTATVAGGCVQKYSYPSRVDNPRVVGSETYEVGAGTLLDAGAEWNGDDVLIHATIGPACRPVMKKRIEKDAYFERRWSWWLVLTVYGIVLLPFPAPDKKGTEYSEQTEWAGRARRCPGSRDESAAGSVIQVELRFDESTWTYKANLGPTGHHVFAGVGKVAQRMANFCGRGELRVSPLLAIEPDPKADTDEESLSSPYTGIRTTPYVWPLEPSFQRDVSDLTSRQMAAVASCLREECIEAEKQRAIASCAATCAPRDTSGECTEPRSRCEAAAESAEHRAVCTDLYNECLASTGVDTSQAQECSTRCALERAILRCQ